MLRVGLTGGIGSGKSTVARMFADRGALVIDADLIARELVEPGQPALSELVEAFGQQILRPDGSLNRGLLAQIAFASPDRTQALNSILHPRIAAESRRRIEAAADAPVVVYDMPLLVETGQRGLVDRVIVVDVPVEEQLRRAVELRGMDPQDVRRRIEAQATRQDRLALADLVVDNSRSLAATQAQVERIWRELLDPDASGSLMAGEHEQPVPGE